MTIRVFEAFAGVGSQRMALRNLGIDYEVVAVSDVDEFAINSYAAIHDSDKPVSQVSDEEMQDYLEKRNIPLNDKGVRKILKGNKLKEFYEACVKSNNLGDISKVVTQDIPDHDLFTYSFPCQDISAAGKGLGLDEGSDTRSSLLWECQKVIAVKKPKYLLLENVKNLVGKKHKHNFDKWLEWLEDQGYKNYWQILNAKDYGVPQNRERVFVVSILGEHEPYEFPGPIELELRLKDILESEVDEKFYLTEVQTERLIQSSDYLRDLTNEPKINILAHRKSYRRNTQAFDPNGITETLDTGQGGEQDVANTLLARDYKGFGNQFMNGVVTTVEPLGTIYANASERFQQGVYPNLSRTLKSGNHDTSVVFDNLSIRKLTPKECWRLMGFSDDDFHKAEEVNSNTQLYKQAGNSIVVDVLEGIFGQLFEK